MGSDPVHVLQMQSSEPELSALGHRPAEPRVHTAILIAADASGDPVQPAGSLSDVVLSLAGADADDDSGSRRDRAGRAKIELAKQAQRAGRLPGHFDPAG